MRKQPDKTRLVGLVVIGAILCLALFSPQDDSGQSKASVVLGDAKQNSNNGVRVAKFKRQNHLKGVKERPPSVDNKRALPQEGVTSLHASPLNSPHTADGGVPSPPDKLSRLQRHNQINSAFAERLEEYKKQAVSSLPSDTKYVVFQRQGSNAGLGNALLGMVSTFLVALVSNRVLLINWDDGHTQLKSPTELDWHHSKASGLSSLKFDVNEDPSNFGIYEKLVCQDFVKDWESQVVIIEANNYFANLVFLNENYRSTLQTWFGESLTNVYAKLASFIVQPNDDIQRIVDNYVENYFKDYMVGLQIRLTDNAPAAQGAEGSFMACGQLLHEQYREAGGKGEVGFFVASDSNNIRSKFKSEAGAQVYPPDGGAVEMYKGTGPLIDVLLLSRTNDVIITSGSTFGTIAYGQGGVVGHVITKSNLCIKTLGSDPCYHGADRIMGVHNQVAKVTCWNPDWMNLKFLIHHRHCWH